MHQLSIIYNTVLTIIKTKLRAMRRLAIAYTRTVALTAKPTEAADKPVRARLNRKMKNLSAATSRPVKLKYFQLLYNSVFYVR